MDENINTIAKKKINYWKKTDRIRNILMRDEHLNYKDATIKASGLVKVEEKRRLDSDNDYMQNHITSLINSEPDPDKEFCEKTGLSEEVMCEIWRPR